MKIVWTERGGPAVEPRTARMATGVIWSGAASGQLGGAITYDWSNEGVIVTLKMKEDRLAG